MMRSRWSLQELAAWASWGRIEERIPELLRPGDLLWPADEAELQRECDRIEAALPKDFRHLPGQALAVSLLARKDVAPDWLRAAVMDRVSPDALGLLQPWEALLGFRWTLVPVATADDETGRLTWFLVGRCEGRGRLAAYPRWWPEVSNEAARKAAAVAFEHVVVRVGGRFFFWPQLPRTDRLWIHGPSLGLPLYLAGWGLAKGCAESPILATGEIAADGSLSMVGGLEHKAAVARRAGLAALLYPRPTRRQGKPAEGLDCIEVENLEEARFFWECYAPGRADVLQHDFRCLEDPMRFAANVHLMDETTVRSRAFQERYAALLPLLLSGGPVTRGFVANIEEDVLTSEGSRERVEAVLGPIVEDRIRALAEKDPPTAFRLTQAALTAYNHLGHVERSRAWAALAEPLGNLISAYEDELNLLARYLNLRFIHDRHNHYDFRPEPPAEIQEVLRRLEEVDRARRRSRRGPSVCIELGKLHGTLAQNYGFCGTRYFPELEHAAARAQEAFGHGEFMNLRPDWRRQFNYLFYALLDAGRVAEAARTLANYLDFPLERLKEAKPEGLNPYEHAAVARFMAESGERFPAYLAWSGRHVADRPAAHPWQLWLNNLGRLSDDPAFREAAWTASVDRAATLGIAGRVMALLPLANLREHGLWDLQRLETATRSVVNELRASTLNKAHFRPVLEADSWEAALLAVQRHRSRLFPFSYR